MGPSAWVMFVIGALLLWGGFSYFLWFAYRTKQRKKQES
ncbi:MetS family NSS transporter small subunit [Hazenella coriacea]|uniref:MetS family NSS transporter small subunit n=1 Tax=Hazenella coriacea TaxID=1179467 RepID=A0A4R3LB37_9BACL|nr:MetS family NSS transporter small subunit [Hazenella coriacea]TCS96932.1 hypothetical protein EDD58_101579 [Hazenella coriacea]